LTCIANLSCVPLNIRVNKVFNEPKYFEAYNYFKCKWDNSVCIITPFVKWCTLFDTWPFQAWIKDAFRNSAHFPNHLISINCGFTQWALKQFLFEEMRRIDLLWESWNAVQVCFECLMFMNFVAFNNFLPIKSTCSFPFQSSCKFAKLPCLI
jgi:hypothetical protein